MSTVAEIQEAIEQLPPEEQQRIREWLTSDRVSSAPRIWTAEELTEGARRLTSERDPAKAELIKDELMRGFYGTANA